jgi:hypothetical protein
VPENPDEVLAAVERYKVYAPDPNYIRNKTLSKMVTFRRNFLFSIQTELEKLGVYEDFVLRSWHKVFRDTFYSVQELKDYKW